MNSSWILPPNKLLKTYDTHNDEEDMEAAWREAATIESRCDELGIALNIVDIKIGPQVTLFSAIPAEKIAIRSLGKLSAELEYALGSESVSIQTPIPGEKYIGISTARTWRRMITLGDVI